MVRLMRKSLSLSTTMRNPERITPFLQSIEEFEGEILNNVLIKKIIIKWIKARLYKSATALRIKPEYKEIYDNKELVFTEEQAEDIYFITEENTRGHKETGFDKGWPSRFDTYMILSKELGYIYYKIGEPIEISETGHLLISTIEPNEDEIVKESDIFLNSLSKFQSNNPFRRNTINNAPFVMFLKTIKILEDEYHWKKRGVYRHEIPFLTCWPNNSSDKLAEYINDFRTQHGLKVSDEIVYEKCLSLLDTDNRKRYKFQQITKEGVDDFIRKFRITGSISLRGGGYLIDINQFEIEKVYYVIDNYSYYDEFKSEYEYYKYMSEIDRSIISSYTHVNEEEVIDKKYEVLSLWAEELSFADLSKEINALDKSSSRHPVLKFIPAPTRFEFLTSIILVKSFPEYTVDPNYSIDDEGMPTNHARGGIGDIEVYSAESDVLVEVTLMRNRNQATNEIPAITRHLKDFSKNKDKNVFSLFIAPSIHEDTKYMIGYTQTRYNLSIKPIVSSDLVKTLKKTDNILNLM